MILYIVVRRMKLTKCDIIEVKAIKNAQRVKQ